MSHTQNKSVIIFVLGLMTALGPFSIDMYLPAFQTIAEQFSTTVARISLSLSSFFIGLSCGQLFYGPLLDRFGRKPPLYVGLSVYVLSSLACLSAQNTESLVAWRFIQALGSCSAGVASIAMVRDLFSLKESAKVYSLLILILGTSPLFAPTIGGYMAAAFGWKSLFLVLALMAVILILIIRFILPESHAADSSVTLRISPIAKTYLSILKLPGFYTYAFAGSISFSGLFVYLAGSPVIFLETFKVSGTQYGWIFAIVATGMIIASQINVQLLKKYSNQQLLFVALIGQTFMGLALSAFSYLEWLNINSMVLMLFLFMGFFGLVNPNAGSLAMAPFAKNAGSASALLGFLQMGIGAVASSAVGALGISTTLPVVLTMATTSAMGLTVLFFGSQRIPKASVEI